MRGLSVLRKGFAVLGKISTMEAIRNKVAESGLITLDPAQLFAVTMPLSFDLKDYLLHGFVLKEQDFRQRLKEFDWSVYSGKLVALHCSNDAIVARWAWMLVAQYVVQAGGSCSYGSPEAVKEAQLLEAIQQWELTPYLGERVILKGCGDESISPAVYTAMTTKLVGVVKTLMYGEPCSTVPVFKKK